VAASGLTSQVSVLPTTPPPSTVSGIGSTLPDTLGTGFGGGSVQSLPATGPGSATGSGIPQASGPVKTRTTGATSFPILGVPSPVGWTVTALLACILVAYPLLLLARWQFLAGRRS
jgi:hypothetical protein